MKFSAMYSKGNTKMSCRNIYPMWFSTEAFMLLEAKIRLLFFGIMCLADTEGRLIYSLPDIWARVAHYDFAKPDDIATALEKLANNDLIIIYDTVIDGFEIKLIQLVDYNHYQAGNSYKAGSSIFPAPQDYIVTETATEKKKKMKMETEKNTPDESFDTFWSLYPRKGNRTDAIKAWQALAPTVDVYQSIINGIDRWSAYWNTIDEQYIPYPARYIKDAMYLQDPPKAKTSKDNDNLREWAEDVGDLPF